MAVSPAYVPCGQWHPCVHPYVFGRGFLQPPAGPYSPGLCQCAERDRQPASRPWRGHAVKLSGQEENDPLFRNRVFPYHLPGPWNHGSGHPWGVCGCHCLLCGNGKSGRGFCGGCGGSAKTGIENQAAQIRSGEALAYRPWR